ncbi:hypothetical protein EDB92DRAFT_2105427 [Lactarius akahatsu]|uniref:Uncharacterized protein n=1 Tax=Lactarius akahatsu TaxID=416441 RepID=A0AAD4L960_9AGAM|nr:hypothetical protein EDB92DRAFT_2106030 [Lactarius akahatsu]KAH8986145.1 hypothetical protein EDB92DRAFT_2105427 [Lactarius akahatsu]
MVALPRRDFLVAAASGTLTACYSARGLTNSADSCGQTWVMDTYCDVCTRAPKCAGRQARHLEYPEVHEDSEWDMGRGYHVKQADRVACDAGSSGWMCHLLFSESVVIFSISYFSASGREIRSTENSLGNSSFVLATYQCIDKVLQESALFSRGVNSHSFNQFSTSAQETCNVV